VWSAELGPLGKLGQKMGRPPDDTPTWDYPDEGSWEAIERTSDSVTFYPRNPSKQPRYERTLPSGEILVDDIHAGLVIRNDYRASFDWSTLKGGGRSLGNRAIMRLQSQGSRWFILSIQERYDESETLVSSELRCVEEYRGNNLIQLRELKNDA
jgi:hypothetical protein